MNQQALNFCVLFSVHFIELTFVDKPLTSKTKTQIWILENDRLKIVARAHVVNCFRSFISPSFSSTIAQTILSLDSELAGTGKP